MKTAIAILFVVAACQAHSNYYVQYWDPRHSSYEYGGSNHYHFKETSGSKFVPSKHNYDAPTARIIDPRIVQSNEELVAKFTFEACNYFESFDCDQTCDLCKLCDSRSDSQHLGCSNQCANGIENCRATCKVSQDQCKRLTSQFSDASGFIQTNNDFSQFSGLADLSIESCQYFEEFNCKETCGFCTLCNTPRGRDQEECKTLCTLGIETCTNICEAGQQKCFGSRIGRLTNLNNFGDSGNFQQPQQPNSIPVDPPAIQSFATLALKDNLVVPTSRNPPPIRNPVPLQTLQEIKCDFCHENSNLKTLQEHISVLPKQTDPAFESNSIDSPAVPDMNSFQSLPLKNDFGFGGRNFQQPQQPNSFPLDPTAIQSFAAVPAVPPLEDNSAVPSFGNQLASRNPVPMQTSQEHTQIDSPFGSKSISRPAVSDINSFQPLNNGVGSRNFQQPQQPNSIPENPPAIQSFAFTTAVPPLEDDLGVPSFGNQLTSRNPVPLQTLQEQIQIEPAFGSKSIPRPAVPDINSFQPLNNGGGSRNFQQLQQPNSISMDPPAIQSFTTVPVVPPLEDDLVVPTFGFPILPKQNDPAFESNSIPRPAVPDTNSFQSMPSRSNFRMNLDFSPFSALSDHPMESCDFLLSFNCKESCGLCNLCNLVPGGSKRPECSSICASGIDTCTRVCEAGQARCDKASQIATIPAPKAIKVSQEITNAGQLAKTPTPKVIPFSREVTATQIPKPFEVTQGITTELTIQTCKSISKSDCKKTCELCKFCNLPGFDKTRPECSMHCVNGIEACPSVCQTVHARCNNAAKLVNTPAPKAIEVNQEITTEISLESCATISKFDCKKTCGLCKFCDLPKIKKTRKECTTHCANGIEACTSTCIAGQERCLKFVSPSSDLSATNNV